MLIMKHEYITMHCYSALTYEYIYCEKIFKSEAKS